MNKIGMLLISSLIATILMASPVLLGTSAFAAPKVGDNTVVSSSIVDGEVKTPDIATDAVTNPKIQDGAVTTNKVADNTVTNDKLADNSVTSPKIRDGTILKEDVKPGEIIGEQGPPGPAGPKGDTGDTGPAGPTQSLTFRTVSGTPVTVGAFSNVGSQVTCPGGTFVTAGGYEAFSADLRIASSRPTAGSVGWAYAIANAGPNTFTFTPIAQCASLTPAP